MCGKIFLVFLTGVGVALASPLAVIIDTGVCSSQTQEGGPLAQAFESELSFDFVTDGKEFSDSNGHGTHVSGILWRELQARGLGQEPCLVMLRAGRDRLQIEKLQRALDAIVELKKKHQVAVVLCAFALGQEDADSAGRDLFVSRLVELLDDDTVIVAATAGKGRNLDVVGEREFFLPGCLNHPNVLTITSCSEKGFLTPRASFGEDSVFAAAPGKQVNSYFLNGETKRLSGSSQAAAHFAAIVYDALTRTENRATVESLREVLMAEGKMHPSLLGKMATNRFFPAMAEPLSDDETSP